MKQVNVLMDEDLLSHLEKISQMVSMFGNKITTSDIVRKATIDYSLYGQVEIESKLENNEIKINVNNINFNKEKDLKETPDGFTNMPSDIFTRRIMTEVW